MSQPIQEENKALVLEAFDTLFNSRDDAPVPGGSPSFATLAAAAQGPPSWTSTTASGSPTR